MLDKEAEANGQLNGHVAEEKHDGNGVDKNGGSSIKLDMTGKISTSEFDHQFPVVAM